MSFHQLPRSVERWTICSADGNTKSLVFKAFESAFEKHLEMINMYSQLDAIQFDVLIGPLFQTNRSWVGQQ